MLWRIVSFAGGPAIDCAHNDQTVDIAGSVVEPTYAITARRMIARLFWKHLNGSGSVTRKGCDTALPASTGLIPRMPTGFSCNILIRVQVASFS